MAAQQAPGAAIDKPANGRVRRPAAARPDAHPPATIVFFGERLNALGAARWRSFAGQPYFDEHGAFFAALVAGPLVMTLFTVLVGRAGGGGGAGGGANRSTRCACGGGDLRGRAGGSPACLLAKHGPAVVRTGTPPTNGWDCQTPTHWQILYLLQVVGMMVEVKKQQMVQKRRQLAGGSGAGGGAAAAPAEGKKGR